MHSYVVSHCAAEFCVTGAIHIKNVVGSWRWISSTWNNINKLFFSW